MKRLVFICLAVSLLSCKKEMVPESINAQVSSNIVNHDFDATTSYPIDIETYSSCTGEYVHVTGTVELRYHATLKDDGAYHISSHSRSVDISGVGVTSGKRYKMLGNYHSAWNYELKGGIYKVNSKFILMTPGGGNNLVVFSSVNFVTNANGEFLVTKTEETVKCQ
jgi:hypothetical protein